MSMIDQLFAAEWISNWWWLWKLIGQFCLGECNDCKLVWKLNKQRNYDEQDRVIGCENVYGWQAKSIDFRLRRSAKFSVMAPLVTTFKLEDHEKKIALYLAVLDHIGLLWFLFSSYFFLLLLQLTLQVGLGWCISAAIEVLNLQLNTEEWNAVNPRIACHDLSHQLFSRKVQRLKDVG